MIGFFTLLGFSILTKIAYKVIIIKVLQINIEIIYKILFILILKYYLIIYF